MNEETLKENIALTQALEQSGGCLMLLVNFCAFKALIY